MNMTIGRRLAEAVGSWLHMEFCCYRAGLLSEGALKAAVGQVLSSFPISSKGTRVYADFPHDGLNPVKRPGRKKEVDFALILAGKGLPKKNAEVLVDRIIKHLVYLLKLRLPGVYKNRGDSVLNISEC